MARVQRLLEWAKQTPPGRVALKAMEDNAPSQAVLIAWNMLQAIFPIALALAAILGAVLSAVGVQSQSVLQTVAAVIPDQAGQQQIFDALKAVSSKTGLFAILALVGFLWSASNLFGALEQAFDVIFHVPMRDFPRQKLMAVFMMLLFCVLAGLAIVTSSVLPLLSQLPQAPLLPQGAGAFLLQLLIGSVAGIILFFAIYFVVPNRKQAVRQVLPGAVLAGLAFELLTLAFPLYFKITGPGMNQYGKTFALLFVLMAYMYFLGLITMIGIELNSVLYPVPIPQPDRPMAMSPAASGSGQPPRESSARRERLIASGQAGGARGGADQQQAESRDLQSRLRRLGFSLLAVMIGLFALSRRRS